MDSTDDGSVVSDLDRDGRDRRIQWSEWQLQGWVRVRTMAMHDRETVDLVSLSELEARWDLSPGCTNLIGCGWVRPEVCDRWKREHLTFTRYESVDPAVWVGSGPAGGTWGPGPWRVGFEADSYALQVFLGCWDHGHGAGMQGIEPGSLRVIRARDLTSVYSGVVTATGALGLLWSLPGIRVLGAETEVRQAMGIEGGGS